MTISRIDSGKPVPWTGRPARSHAATSSPTDARLDGVAVVTKVRPVSTRQGLSRDPHPSETTFMLSRSLATSSPCFVMRWAKGGLAPRIEGDAAVGRWRFHGWLHRRPPRKPRRRVMSPSTPLRLAGSSLRFRPPRQRPGLHQHRTLTPCRRPGFRPGGGRPFHLPQSGVGCCRAPPMATLTSCSWSSLSLMGVNRSGTGSRWCANGLQRESVPDRHERSLRWQRRRRDHLPAAVPPAMSSTFLNMHRLRAPGASEDQ